MLDNSLDFSGVCTTPVTKSKRDILQGDVFAGFKMNLRVWGWQKQGVAWWDLVNTWWWETSVVWLLACACELLGVGFNADLLLGTSFFVLQMDKPGIPWQHGGTWEGLLVLPVMLWMVWAGPASFCCRWFLQTPLQSASPGGRVNVLAVSMAYLLHTLKMQKNFE